MRAHTTKNIIRKVDSSTNTELMFSNISGLAYCGCLALLKENGNILTQKNGIQWCIFVKFLVSEKWKVWMWTKSGIEYLYCIVETKPAGEGTNRIQTMKLFRFPSIRLMLCEHMVSSVPKMRKQSIYEIKIRLKTANWGKGNVP